MTQPVFYLSHGAGPCFWMTWPAPFGPGAFDGLERYLEDLAGRLPERPKAILMVSAHWEAEVATVSTAATPEMIFDYYGFPAETYQLSYPASGDPALAGRVRALLSEAGIANAEDGGRGFDHGVFVPLLKAFPEADIPVVTLSLRHDLDAAAHIAIGQALAPLREEGVLILTSGMSYHNLREFRDGAGEAAAGFDAWLLEAVVGRDEADRNARLTDWQGAPFARAAHPREEHLIPLMVAAGAAGADPGRLDFAETIGGKRVSGFAFW